MKTDLEYRKKLLTVLEKQSKSLEEQNEIQRKINLALINMGKILDNRLKE